MVVARRPRKPLKIFAENIECAVIGSLLDGDKLTSSLIASMQALNGYTDGFDSIVVPGSDPNTPKNLLSIPELNALKRIDTEQLCYIFQQGIPEIDGLTTYDTNSIGKKADSFELYGSVADNNLNQSLSNAAAWKKLIDLGTILEDIENAKGGVGTVGPQGDKGPDGDQGPQGDAGPAGEQGSGWTAPLDMVIKVGNGTQALAYFPYGHTFTEIYWFVSLEYLGNGGMATYLFNPRISGSGLNMTIGLSGFTFTQFSQPFNPAEFTWMVVGV